VSDSGHGCQAKNLLGSGRQREPAKVWAQLAYLVRQRCAMNTIEIARRLKRDPLTKSHLCANYEAVRNLKTEIPIAQIIEQ
jgi:hypothetical protein